MDNQGGIIMGAFFEKDHKDVWIRTELKPGDLGAVVALHGTLYAKEYGFDATFETYVARPLCDFVLQPSKRQKIWLVEREGTVKGCIAIVEASPDAAQLRWFLLHPDIRGLGLGRYLVNEAVKHCRVSGFSEVFLWTLDSLKAALKLYREEGFTLAEEERHVIWGQTVTEQKFTLSLAKPIA